jgi:hypothetical protein
MNSKSEAKLLSDENTHLQTNASKTTSAIKKLGFLPFLDDQVANMHLKK